MYTLPTDTPVVGSHQYESLLKSKEISDTPNPDVVECSPNASSGTERHCHTCWQDNSPCKTGLKSKRDDTCLTRLCKHIYKHPQPEHAETS